MLAPGTYRARAVEGALGKTTAEKEQVAVRFQTLDPVDSVVWYGFFSEKTEDHTMKGLAACGWDWIATEIKPDAPEVSIVVEHEEGRDGVVRAKVRWVNEARGLGLKRRMTNEETEALRARLIRHESVLVPSAVVRAEAQDADEAPFNPDDPNAGLPF